MATLFPFAGPRAQARQLIGLFSGKGWSPERMIKYLEQEKGLFVARRWVKQDIREIWGKSAVAGKAKFLSFGAAPSKRIMADVPMMTTTKYQYRFEFVKRDARGNVVDTQYRMFSTDAVLTRGEAQQAFKDMYLTREQRASYESEGGWLGDYNMQLEAVFHHEGWGY